MCSVQWRIVPVRDSVSSYHDHPPNYGVVDKIIPLPYYTTRQRLRKKKKNENIYCVFSTRLKTPLGGVICRRRRRRPWWVVRCCSLSCRGGSSAAVHCFTGSPRDYCAPCRVDDDNRVFAIFLSRLVAVVTRSPAATGTVNITCYYCVCTITRSAYGNTSLLCSCTHTSNLDCTRVSATQRRP